MVCFIFLTYSNQLIRTFKRLKVCLIKRNIKWTVYVQYGQQYENIVNLLD